MSQLRPGARQALDYIYADIQMADEYAADANQTDIRNLLFEIKNRLKEQIEPMLARASNEPSLEARVKRLEDFVSAYMQNAAQHT